MIPDHVVRPLDELEVTRDVLPEFERPYTGPTPEEFNASLKELYGAKPYVTPYRLPRVRR